MADKEDQEYEQYLKQREETDALVLDATNEAEAAFKERLRSLVLRIRAALPSGVRWPRPDVALADILRDIDRHWERKHGRGLSEEQQRQKTRMVRDATQLHHESRELYRSSLEVMEHMKAIIAEYLEERRVWQLAEKIVARRDGNAEAVRKANRASRGSRRRVRPKARAKKS